MGLKFDDDVPHRYNSLNDIQRKRLDNQIKELKRRVDEFKSNNPDMDEPDAIDHSLTAMEREQALQHWRETVALEIRHLSFEEECVGSTERLAQSAGNSALANVMVVIVGVISVMFAPASVPLAVLPGCIMVGAGIAGFLGNLHLRRMWRRTAERHRARLKEQESKILELEQQRPSS